MRNNRTRVLADVVSIDAWHQPIVVNGNTATVHVELTFKQGRVGGNDDKFPFTFRVALKKALLTVTVENPLEVDRDGISRNVPEAQVEHSKLRVAKEQAKSKLAAGAKISPAHLVASLSGSRQSEQEVSRDDQLKLVQALPLTLVTYEPVSRNEYRWTLDPTFHPELSGQPWDPVASPRMSVKMRGERPKIDPCIKVELSCALEDLEISDIVPKEDQKFAEKMINVAFPDKNKAAAIQHLKLILRDADLEPGKLDNRFSQVILASVIALES